MKIVLDVLGGDNAPKAPLDGAVSALKKREDLNLVLVGPKDIILEAMQKAGVNENRYEIIEATEQVTNEDHPANFLRTKPNCSMSLAFRALKERDDIEGMLSAGPTGALLSGCIFRVGRIPGVKRPALLATLPNKKGGVVRLTDAGANMDCKPEYVVQFAKMADAYLRAIGVASPRIATLSVGMEEGKGNELVKEVYANLKEGKEINFVGNIEGDKALDDLCDVIVCDGFAGNVFVKSLEGGAYFVSDLFKAAIFKNIFTKFGALFQLKGLKNVKKPFNYAKDCCAPLLGCSKLVIKTHGKSKATNFEGSLLETARLADAKLIEKIASAIKIEEQKTC